MLKICETTLINRMIYSKNSLSLTYISAHLTIKEQVLALGKQNKQTKKTVLNNMKKNGLGKVLEMHKCNF